jgi:hypothetical protein
MVHMGEGRKVYKVFMGKSEGKRSLRREDGIKMALREIGWEVWSGFTQLRTGTCGGLL